MDLSFTFTLTLFFFFFSSASTGCVMGSSFTFVNRCSFTVWPGILANAGSPQLDSTGFVLSTDTSRSMLAPTGWSGRFWGRTGCDANGSGSLSCLTGDCGSGTVECNGLGATPPATLAEFTLGNSGGQDFYDVSLVDGYNMPMLIEVSGGSGMCASTGCSADLNQQCPAELRVGEGEACKSACEAFGSPEYCCSGAYNSPVTCRPSLYSEMFKAACPRSYSYAYDDKTSTFTCTGADYTVTFCPSSPSQKTTSPTPVTSSTSTATTVDQGSGSIPATTVDQGSGSIPATTVDQGSGSIPGGMGFAYTNTGSGLEPGSEAGGGSESGGAIMADETYLAGLAMGGSMSLMSPCAIHQNAIVALYITILYIAHVLL